MRPWNSSFQCLNDLRTIASPFISTNYRKISSGIWTRLSPKNQRRPFPIFISKARGWTRSNVHKTLKPWLFDRLISVFCSCCLAASSNLVSPLREEVPLRVPSPTGRSSSKGFLPHGKAFYRGLPPSLEGVPLWGPSCSCRSSWRVGYLLEKKHRHKSADLIVEMFKIIQTSAKQCISEKFREAIGEILMNTY